MTDTTQTHDIVASNLTTYTKELASYILDGWAISKANPGTVVGMYGGSFTATLYRNTATVQGLRDKVEEVEEAPKPNRGAILAAARAAKAAKKVNVTLDVTKTVK